MHKQCWNYFASHHVTIATDSFLFNDMIIRSFASSTTCVKPCFTVLIVTNSGTWSMSFTASAYFRILFLFLLILKKFKEVKHMLISNVELVFNGSGIMSNIIFLKWFNDLSSLCRTLGFILSISPRAKDSLTELNLRNNIMLCYNSSSLLILIIFKKKINKRCLKLNIP